MKKLAILLVSIFSSAFCYAAYTGGVVGGAVIAPYWYAPDSTPYVTISSHTRVSDGGSNHVDIDPIVGFSGPGAGLTDLDWGALTNFPASCAPQCVVAIGTTLTCGACSGGGGSDGGNAYTESGVVGQIPVYVAVDSITASGIQPSQIAYTDRFNIFSSSQQITYTLVGPASSLTVLNSTDTTSLVLGRVGITGIGAAYVGGKPNNFNGIGVVGVGVGALYPTSSYGVYGRGRGPYANYGVYGVVSDAGVFNSGITGIATGLGTYNYGVYGSASNGVQNYAGYFDGNVYSSGTITADKFSGDGSLLTNVPVSANTAYKNVDNNFCATQTFQYGLATSTASFSSTATFKSPAQFNGVATSTPAVTNAQYKANMTGAWAYFDGTTSPPTLTSGFNIAGLTKTGTGDYRVYFANAFAAGNAYVCMCTTGRAEASDYGDCVVQGLNQPGYIDVATYDNAATRTDRARVSILCVGAQ